MNPSRSEFGGARLRRSISRRRAGACRVGLAHARAGRARDRALRGVGVSRRVSQNHWERATLGKPWSKAVEGSFDNGKESQHGKRPRGRTHWSSRRGARFFFASDVGCKIDLFFFFGGGAYDFSAAGKGRGGSSICGFVQKRNPELFGEGPRGQIPQTVSGRNRFGDPQRAAGLANVVSSFGICFNTDSLTTRSRYPATDGAGPDLADPRYVHRKIAPPQIRRKSSSVNK